MRTLAEIVASGDVELYVAGALDPVERAAFEDALLRYPELEREVHAVAEAVEIAARARAKAPRPGHKERVMAAITTTEQAPDIVIDNHPAPVLALDVTGQRSDRRSRVWQYAAVASLLIGIVTTSVLSIMLGEAHDELEHARRELSIAKNEQRVLASRVVQYQDVFSSVSDTNTVRVALAGTANAPASLASLYWNRSTKDVVIDFGKMPRVDDGQDYQLWAIVNGKPVDLGVFNPDNSQERLAIMRDVESPSAFAVTVEPRGGRPEPTLEAMVAIGTL
ncbi:MAG: anti-sigma factor [Candidatus Kapabacteria bacterium]|jgi:anti-sigma-K factor RskA|nr:anti-sigma factor [Candidatus Kapabacteria bacterium]